MQEWKVGILNVRGKNQLLCCGIELVLDDMSNRGRVKILVVHDYMLLETLRSNCLITYNWVVKVWVFTNYKNEEWML